jgi:metal-responsive CopG/Arc/MetJ family transcriptional regulator
VAKVFVSIPDDLLERVDREAKRRRTSRSAFLQQAARRELGWPEPEAIDAALKRGRAALATSGSFESSDMVRSGRDERDARDRDRH